MRRSSFFLAHRLNASGRTSQDIIVASWSDVFSFQLTSLPYRSQVAQLSTKPPGDRENKVAEDDQLPTRAGHLPRQVAGKLRLKVEQSEMAIQAQVVAKEDRHQKIQELLGESKTPAASEFVSSFFSDNAGARVVDREEENYVSSVIEEDLGSSSLPLNVPSPLNEQEENMVLAELKGLKRGAQRKVLQRLLQGGMLDVDPVARQEWAAIQEANRPPEGLKMKVVDVNRTCKGSRSGGLYRYSCMVVVGNGEGVLGWGQGKAAEMNSAVEKAYARAARNLFPVPRYNNHTVPQRIKSKYGQVSVLIYPKSAGRGIIASPLVMDILKLAGIHDAGVKIHGSRNKRNLVKCLFEAFDRMQTHEEITSGDKLIIVPAPSKFSSIQM